MAKLLNIYATASDGTKVNATPSTIGAVSVDQVATTNTLGLVKLGDNTTQGQENGSNVNYLEVNNEGKGFVPAFDLTKHVEDKNGTTTGSSSTTKVIFITLKNAQVGNGTDPYFCFVGWGDVIEKNQGTLDDISSYSWKEPVSNYYFCGPSSNDFTAGVVGPGGAFFSPCRLNQDGSYTPAGSFTFFGETESRTLLLSDIIAKQQSDWEIYSFSVRDLEGGIFNPQEQLSGSTGKLFNYSSSANVCIGLAGPFKSTAVTGSDGVTYYGVIPTGGGSEDQLFSMGVNDVKLLTTSPNIFLFYSLDGAEYEVDGTGFHTDQTTGCIAWKGDIIASRTDPGDTSASTTTFLENRVILNDKQYLVVDIEHLNIPSADIATKDKAGILKIGDFTTALDYDTKTCSVALDDDNVGIVPSIANYVEEQDGIPKLFLLLEFIYQDDDTHPWYKVLNVQELKDSGIILDISSPRALKESGSKAVYHGSMKRAMVHGYNLVFDGNAYGITFSLGQKKADNSSIQYLDLMYISDYTANTQSFVLIDDIINGTEKDFKLNSVEVLKSYSHVQDFNTTYALGTWTYGTSDTGSSLALNFNLEIETHFNRTTFINDSGFYRPDYSDAVAIENWLKYNIKGTYDPSGVFPFFYAANWEYQNDNTEPIGFSLSLDLFSASNGEYLAFNGEKMTGSGYEKEYTQNRVTLNSNNTLVVDIDHFALADTDRRGIVQYDKNYYEVSEEVGYKPKIASAKYSGAVKVDNIYGNSGTSIYLVVFHSPANSDTTTATVPCGYFVLDVTIPSCMENNANENDQYSGLYEALYFDNIPMVTAESFSYFRKDGDTISNVTFNYTSETVDNTTKYKALWDVTFASGTKVTVDLQNYSWTLYKCPMSALITFDAVGDSSTTNPVNITNASALLLNYGIIKENSIYRANQTTAEITTLVNFTYGDPPTNTWNLSLFDILFIPSYDWVNNNPYYYFSKEYYSHNLYIGGTAGTNGTIATNYKVSTNYINVVPNHVVLNDQNMLVVDTETLGTQEEWTFTLDDDTTVTKKIILA